MRVALLDRSQRGTAARVPGFPSPALLQAGAVLAAEGHEVTYLDNAAPDPTVERVVVLARPWEREAARRQAAKLGAAEQALIDPWAVAPSERLPAYGAATSDCHADVDLGPGAPVHPWAVPSAAAVVPARADEQLRAAAAGLAGLRSANLVVGDERVPLSEDRLRQLAEVVSASLRDRNSLINLYVRAWPADLAPERMLDHLSLLPVRSLDVLVGTLHGPSLSTMGSPLGRSEMVALVGALAASGLAPVTTLSIVAGLPDESIEAGVAVLDATLKLAAEHDIPAVRCALRLDGGPPPTDPMDQKTRFLAAHPSWSETEYRGFHDLVAVIRQVAPNIDLIGPGFVPTWDEVP